jgi:hypothetical protein
MTAFFSLSGPDRYCPYCKRRLIKIHNDGTFDLASNAAVDGSRVVTWSADDEVESEETTFEARCLRKRCQFRAIIGSAIRA